MTYDTYQTTIHAWQSCLTCSRTTAAQPLQSRRNDHMTRDIPFHSPTSRDKLRGSDWHRTWEEGACLKDDQIGISAKLAGLVVTSSSAILGAEKVLKAGTLRPLTKGQVLTLFSNESEYNSSAPLLQLIYPESPPAD